MTTNEHSRLLGIFHLVYGGLHALLLVVGGAAMFGILRVLTEAPGRDAPPFGFLLAMMGSIFVLSLLFLIPPLLAGYGLMKRKRWARTASIVAAILMALNVPVGTALAVYSLWFHFGQGRRLYADSDATRPRYSLGDAPPGPDAGWFAGERGREREYEYVPPAQPPDWR